MQLSPREVSIIVTVSKYNMENIKAQLCFHLHKTPAKGRSLWGLEENLSSQIQRQSNVSVIFVQVNWTSAVLRG